MILALGGIEGLSMKHVKTLTAVEHLMRYSKPSPQTFLMHYGVKGMKWGIRRTPEELRYNSSSVIASVNRKGINVVTSTGDRIASMSSHAGDQARQREVSAKEIIDALRSPLYIKPVKYDAQGRPSKQYIGASATVCVNPENAIISSIWKTGSKTRLKYQKGGA